MEDRKNGGMEEGQRDAGIEGEKRTVRCGCYKKKFEREGGEMEQEKEGKKRYGKVKGKGY